MPAFGSVSVPVRSSMPMEVNSPDGFMTEPPGDLWWIGLHAWWDAAIPSSVTKAESVLINPLVRMPWIVTEPDGGEYRPGDTGYPAWLLDPMVLNGSTGGPNKGEMDMLDRLDRFDFWAYWVRSAMRHGIGVLTFREDANDLPLAGTLRLHGSWTLYRSDTPPLDRSNRPDDEKLSRWAIDAVDGRVLPISKDGYIRDPDLPQSQHHKVAVLRHSIPGGVFGRHRAELRLANRMRTYTDESLDSNVPSGVMTTEQPISRTQSETIRGIWESTMTRRRLAVIGNGAKYQPVAWSPVEAEIAALMGLSDKQVAHMYELSAFEVDAPSGDSMTYANISEKRQDRVDGPLASWSARLEETLSAILPWGSRVRIDFTEYTTATTKGAGDVPVAAA